VAKRVPPPAAAKRSHGTPSEQMARDAIAHAEPAPRDKVRMTFRVVLSRRQAEALTARAIREERSLLALVTELLESAPTRGSK
jgi:hypothetical protein